MCEQPESLSCCVATVHAVCLGGGTDGHPVYSSRCVVAKRRGMSMVFWRARVHEEPQSLGCCGLITRAVCLDADTALSHGLSPCELVRGCVGGREVSAVAARCLSARERVRMDGAAAVVCTSSRDHRFGAWSDRWLAVRSQPVVLCRG